MEPSFVATPYMLVSTPSSAEIRAMLDQQEARYLEWRRARKSIRHSFASQKLNSECKLSPVTVGRSLEGVPSPTSPVQAVRQKYSLGSADMLARASGKRKDAIQLGLGLPASRQELPRLSFAVDESVPEVESGPSSRATGGRTRKQSAGKITHRPTVTIASLGPNVAANSSDEASSGSVRMPRVAYKYLKPYLHDYYTRQVFSCASSRRDDERDEDLLNTADSDATDGIGTDTVSVEQVDAAKPPSSRGEQAASDCAIAGLGLVAQHTYNAIFELDWQASGVDKTVRDAVDRRRIASIVRSDYHVLLWFFRYYAGNAAVNSSAVATGRPSTSTVSDRLAAALGTKLFEIPSALKLLEDLNIQCVDPTTFGITDTPIKRENLIDLVLGVARMNCAHAANPTQHRVLVSDGIELSESVRVLVHEHFAAFSQIQDVNHFRVVFLRKHPRSSSTVSGSEGRSLEQILQVHAVNLSNFFEELTRLGAGLISSGGGSNASTKASRGTAGGAGGVSCAQFVSLLHALKLIAVKSATNASSADSSATAATSLAATPADASVGIEEVRAVRIFLTCLPMDQSAPAGGVRGSVVTQSSQPQELRLPQFIEALLRIALSWRERAICRGRYDVCPGQMSSDVCSCLPESVDYAFDVFRDAVEEVLNRIYTHRLARVQKRATIKMASIRSVRLPGSRTNGRMSVLSTSSGYSGVKEEEQTSSNAGRS
jgi:hypothetical protein